MIQELKKKIIEQLKKLDNWINDGFRRLCEKPSPKTRFVVVSIFGGILTIIYVCMLAGSIFNIGKCDAKNDFLELQHIETLKLQGENDSSNILNQKNYEYE